MRFSLARRHDAGTATFLGSLRRDVRGNTLAIMAIAVIPLTAMIGSGVDMTRAYMAQNRLRQACDAGSLAGRRLLAGTTVSSEVRTETTKYFEFNFPQNFFQSATYNLTITAPTTGTLKVETQTTIPTTLMRMFGFETLPITAACSATQDFVNTDIMMVFDLSASMNCPPGVSGGCSTERSGSKMDALRDAADNLYDTLKPAQDQLHANNLRLRYGFVNYNSTINVGRALVAKNPDWLVDSWTYQSRWAKEPVDATAAGIRDKSSCNGAYLRDDLARQYGFAGVAAGYWQRQFRGLPYGCLVYAQRGNTDDAATYTYGLATSVDVSRYTQSNPATPLSAVDASVYVGPPPGSQKPDPRPSYWDGCIEERQTNNSVIDGGTSTTAPANAYDLDIDLIPYSDATRWRPMWQELQYYRNGSRPSYECPTEARRLTEYYNSKASFTSYIDGLKAAGSTYHDLGMIWGARFISQTGIFAANPADTNNVSVVDNPKTIRGFSVKRYMIFMTDGDMQPSDVYSAYGIESLDKRVTAGNSNQLKRHLQRFRMACNAAKSKGIDIWVIAFSTTLTPDMENCASKPSQAAGLSTKADLITKFKEIGSKIGALRLSQ